jgi:acyl-CoA synthetase (NDP forming)
MTNWVKIDEIFQKIRDKKRNALTEIEAKQLLQYLDIPIPDIYLAKTAEEAVNLATKIGFPVVLKIVSPEIIHKSDASGVVLNLESEEEVKYAYENIINGANQYDPYATIEGVSVQKMEKGGTEVIVGMNRDQNFGPVLLFGLGGVFVELLKDVSLRVLPIAEEDIEKMLTEIQGSKMLTGFRGQKPADLNAIKKIILKIAKAAERYPEISEMEINPILVKEDGMGAIALDARVITEQAAKEVTM